MKLKNCPRGDMAHYIRVAEMGACRICGQPTRGYCTHTQQYICARRINRRLACRLTHEQECPGHRGEVGD
jgi:hypothetical protein